MRRSSEPRIALLLVLGVGLAIACGGDETDGRANTESAEAAASAETPSEGKVADGSSVEAASPGDRASDSSTIAGRPRELVNPDPESVVMLYYSLAKIAFPFDRVVAEDARVSMAKPIDKQPQRDAVRAELEGLLAAVQDVGALRISMNANLSDYDPTYGEFTVRALAPSSVVTFDGFREYVELRFSNGLSAQIWKVPADQAQLVRDKIGPMQAASTDVLVRITGAQPSAGGGGTIQTEIVEYELRADPSGDRLARIRVIE